MHELLPVFEARFYKAVSRVAGGALIKTISRKIQRAPSNGRTNVRAHEYISKIRYVVEGGLDKGFRYRINTNAFHWWDATPDINCGVSFKRKKLVTNSCFHAKLTLQPSTSLSRVSNKNNLASLFFSNNSRRHIASCSEVTKKFWPSSKIPLFVFILIGHYKLPCLPWNVIFISPRKKRPLRNITQFISPHGLIDIKNLTMAHRSTYEHVLRQRPDAHSLKSRKLPQGVLYFIHFHNCIIQTHN